MNLKKTLSYVLGTLAIAAFSSVFLCLIYFIGYSRGYAFGVEMTEEMLVQSRAQTSAIIPSATSVPTPTPQVIVVTPPQRQAVSWSGPELWEAVNKRRQENGVPSLGNQGELCTIASIRLNELLELGRLDGHEGFSNLPTRRPDLKWIFDKYNISEFLVSGAESAQEAVNLWENTLGHRKLLTGGEYVWGCSYAQNGFGVAIAAY